MPLECHMRYDFYSSLLVRTLTPLGVIGLLLGVAALALARHAREPEETKWKRRAGQCFTAIFLQPSETRPRPSSALPDHVLLCSHLLFNG